MRRVSTCLFALAACVQTPELATLNVVIGPAGAAGIGAQTPMTREAIAAAAPEYVVEEGETVSGERRFPRFALSLDGEVVFSLYPAPDRSRPTGIGTRSTRARGANGEVIGATSFAGSVGIERDQCRLAMAHERFTFSCPDTSGSFWRAYLVAESYRGPRDPFVAIEPAALDAAILAQMYWTPRAD